LRRTARRQNEVFFFAAWKYFKHAVFLIRDPGHAVRLAIVKPLRVEEMFAPVLKELIGPEKAERRKPKPAGGGAHGIKGGGLIPDITHSDKWKEQLAVIQKTWKAHPSSKQDAMEVALRHFSFAFHRMDSAADPVAKTALLLIPICVLLSYISRDTRSTSQATERAAALLKKSTPKFLVAWGISADWGLLTLSFLRLFDSSHHDIANSEAQVKEVITLLDDVFCSGKIMSAPACGGDEGKALFISDHMQRQIKVRDITLLAGHSLHDIGGAARLTSTEEKRFSRTHAAPQKPASMPFELNSQGMMRGSISDTCFTWIRYGSGTVRPTSS
jgi:hypothetical protein